MNAIKSHHILIISASIGSGHTQAANAIRNEFVNLSPASRVTVVDFMASFTPLSLIKETYLKMIDLVPNTYDLLYRWSQEPFPGTKAINMTGLIMKNRLLELLRRYQPDLVVFTHPFPCCAAAYLRRLKHISVPLAAIITDFTAHRFWLHREVDLFFVAGKEVKESLSSKGIARDRIFVTGIPVSPRFGSILEKPHDPEPGQPTILIMGGGLGLGAIQKTVGKLASLTSPLALIVITGRNDTLRNRLTALKPTYPHRLDIIGYTDHIPEFMAKSDILITKPGALTCSEALVMQLPLLLLNPIPGQEEDNADYLTRQGAAVRIDSDDQLVGEISYLLAHPAALNNMRLAARNLARPTAAAAIANISLNHLSANRFTSHVS